MVFVSMYSCCFLCWNTSRPGREIACSLARSRQWGICSRNITPEPVMSRTFERSKLAVNRERSAVDCSLFEVRWPKLAAVCNKVCVRFFRTYEYEYTPPPPPLSLSLLGRLHVQSELFSSIFNVRRAVYAQDQDTVFFCFYTFLIKYILTELSVILRCTTSSTRHHHALLAELMHEA